MSEKYMEGWNPKNYFNDKCPYTEETCETFKCEDCEVERRERKWVYGEEKPSSTKAKMDDKSCVEDLKTLQGFYRLLYSAEPLCLSYAIGRLESLSKRKRRSANDTKRGTNRKDKENKEGT